MARKLLLTGCLSAVLLAAYGFIDSARQPARAQPAAVVPPAAAGRYQINSFVIEGRTPGAYILDTQTGDVVQVIGRDEPVRVGSAARPLTPKSLRVGQ